MRLVVTLAVGTALVVGAGLAATEWRWTRQFDAPYPVIEASSNPAIVATGKYLVYGPAACAYCHVPRSEWATLDQGTALPLTGHHLFRLPFGEIYSSNITPDAVTGMGRRTDAELARVLRYGVRADGRAAFPLMEFQLSDEDLVAVISFLRSQTPVSHAVPEHRLSRFGKALMAFAITPTAPAHPPPGSSPTGPSIERGEYLANAVSSCVSCHTDRGPDGALVGPRFGGGQRMDVAADETKVYVSRADGARGFDGTARSSFNEWHEGHPFEPMKDAMELTPEERARGYHDPEDGAHRLNALGRLLAEVINPG